MDFNTTQTPQTMAHRKIRLVFLLVGVVDAVAISRNEVEDDMSAGTEYLCTSNEKRKKRVFLLGRFVYVLVLLYFIILYIVVGLFLYCVFEDSNH